MKSNSNWCGTYPKWGNRLVFNVLLISNFLWLKKVFSHGLVPPLILRPGSGSHAVDPLSVRASPTLALFAANSRMGIFLSSLLGLFFFLDFWRSWPLIKSFFSLLFSWGTNKNKSFPFLLASPFFFTWVWLGDFFLVLPIDYAFALNSVSNRPLIPIRSVLEYVS